MGLLLGEKGEHFLLEELDPAQGILLDPCGVFLALVGKGDTRQAQVLLPHTTVGDN